MTYINFEEGMSYNGDWRRLRKTMEKARRGEPITVGFLGGSITQGSLSSLPTTCYAYLVYDWWVKTFPQSQVAYVNAGIGGTTSHFGVGRVKEDLLSYEPDFTAVEFSVNDDNTPFFRETYEGLVRTIYQAESQPAMVIIHNVFYESGTNAQDQHELVGRRYGVPCVSIKTSVYREVANGNLPTREITPDDLHPNDVGHRLLADLAIYFLEKVYATLDVPEEQIVSPQIAEQFAQMPAPITANGYEHSMRYRNHNCQPILDGYVADTEPQHHITETFRKGWISEKAGDSITFEVEGSSIAVQYRKSVKHPACVAKAVVDGNEEEAIRLDGNFDETWGDCLYLQPLLHHGADEKHIIKITTMEGTKGVDVPFYLVSVIASR